MRPAPAALTLLSAVLSLTALAGDDDEALPPDVECKEAKGTCKEDCSLDYGMSEATRAKVPKCLADCEQAEVICLARHVAKRHAGQAKADRERYAAPSDEQAAPPMDDDLPPVRKRTSTKAADLKAAPDKTPEGYQEKVFSKPVPEEPKVAPAPAPPPPAEQAKPPPPQKKKPRKRAPVSPTAE